MKSAGLIIFLIILLSSCIKLPFSGPKKNTNPLFDTIPVNFTDLNSVYDDYNSAYPPGLWGFEKEIAFSTNRFSEGQNFDFITFFISVQYETEEGKLTEIKGQAVHESFSRQSFHYANSGYNEMGPYYWKIKYQNTVNRQSHAFLYSSDTLGNDNIMGLIYDWNNPANNSGGPEVITWLKGFDPVNTGNNESYPTIRKNMLYFNSDRAGYYNIYSCEIKNDNVFESYEIELSPTVNFEAKLSGPSDDKCPFILEDVMVFTSNRDGGYGGFDLYYSVFENGQWSDAVNFGSNINTEFDEYRPVIIPTGDNSGNDLMMFSSNRPGGSGGFDLYYVGVPKEFKE